MSTIRTTQLSTACRPRSIASTSAVVYAYTWRRSGSPKSGRRESGKPPTNPFAPTTPTSYPATSTIVELRSSTQMPASRQTATTSSRRFACQSWFPSTATTGTERPRHASASTSACSGSPCVVRSPASSTRSASCSTCANAAATAARRDSSAWTSPAAATRSGFPFRCIPAIYHGAAVCNRPHGVAAARGNGCRRRGVPADAEEGGGRTARCRHPVHPRRRHGRLGARRVRHRPRPRLHGEAGGRGARARHPRARWHEAGATAGGLAAEGMGREGAGRPDPQPVRTRHHRRRDRAQRRAAGLRDRDARHAAGRHPRHEADGDDRAHDELPQLPRDRPCAARADRLGQRPVAHRELRVRARVLHARRRARHPRRRSAQLVRVAVVGATGNVGTSLLRSLEHEPAVESIVGLARRRPDLVLPKVEWAEADVAHDDLVPHLRGADVVVHLAWLIQPSRDLDHLWLANVEGSSRVFGAAAHAGARALVYASSVGAYSRGPKDRRVDESWPTQGIPTSTYARHKAEVERRLDAFERDHGHIRVVRLRPGLIFKREAASGIRRLFAGPFLPSPLVRRWAIPIVPDVDGLAFQAVHSHDVGDAYRLAIVRDDARGAYNVAAEPVLDPPELARVLGARPVAFSGRALRTAADVAFRLRLQPTEAGWIDLALGVPLMDTRRAREELGWVPEHGADDALRELLDGIRDGAGLDTPPLAAKTSGPLRVRELAGRLGGKETL